MIGPALLNVRLVSCHASAPIFDAGPVCLQSNKTNSAGINGQMTPILYDEYRPSARLSDYVDSYWRFQNNDAHRAHRVLPDGCADILFHNPSEGDHELMVIGAMTKAAVFDLPKGQFVGVRFRPGMVAAFVRVPGTRMVDTLLPLEETWGPKAKQLAAELLDTESGPELAKSFESHLLAHLSTHFRTQPVESHSKGA